MIPYGKHHLEEDDIKAVVDVLRNGGLTQGPMVERFEEAVASYVGSKYAVAVSNGTAALHLASLALGLDKKSAIVTSPITFVASANAGSYVGSKVLFCDIDAKTINISIEHLAQTLENHREIKTIIPVHFAGFPCDMSAMSSIAEKYDVTIIEDAAHALGSKYPNGELVGSCKYSSMTIFSFHPVKAIATGEGGMITTNDEYLYRKLIRLRSHGINKLNDSFIYEDQSMTDDKLNTWYYEMQDLGYNYRISDFQCALGLSQLSKLEKFIARRKYLVERYDEAFSHAVNLCPIQNSDRNLSAHHLYILRIDFDKINLSRAEIMLELKTRGIMTQVHYIPVPAQPYYKQLGNKAEDYPNSNSYYKECLTIPLFYDLTDQQQDKIISTIKELVY